MAPPPVSRGIDPQRGAATQRLPQPFCAFRTLSRLRTLWAASLRAYANGSGDIAVPVTRSRSVHEPSRRARGVSCGARYQVVVRPSRAVYGTRVRRVKPLQGKELHGSVKSRATAFDGVSYRRQLNLDGTRPRPNDCLRDGWKRADSGSTRRPQNGRSFSTVFPPVIHRTTRASRVSSGRNQSRLAAYSASFERSPFTSCTWAASGMSAKWWTTWLKPFEDESM